MCGEDRHSSTHRKVMVDVYPLHASNHRHLFYYPLRSTNNQGKNIRQHRPNPLQPWPPDRHKARLGWPQWYASHKHALNYSPPIDAECDQLDHVLLSLNCFGGGMHS